MKQLILLFCILGLAFSCAKKKEDSSSSASSITVSGTMGTAKANGLKDSKEISSLTLTDYKFFCVAFNAAATSASSDFSGGAFSLSMPQNTPFGCFVVNKTSLAIAATVKIKGTGTGMSDTSTGSMNMASSVSLGNITLTEGSTVIEVAESQVASSVAADATAKISLTDIHNTSWTMTCVNSGDTKMDEACDCFVNGNGCSDSGSPHVYLRILKATKSSADVYGIGVWASSSDFTTCGSIDMTTTEASTIVTDEGGAGTFSWVQNTTGANFTNAGSTSSTCPIRDANGSTVGADHENIKKYYVMSKLTVSGSSYTLLSEYTDNIGANCTMEGKTSLTFNPTSATEMYGNFNLTDNYIDATGHTGACTTLNASNTDRASNFVVKFTKE